MGKIDSKHKICNDKFRYHHCFWVLINNALYGLAMLTCRVQFCGVRGSLFQFFVRGDIQTKPQSQRYIKIYFVNLTRFGNFDMVSNITAINTVLKNMQKSTKRSE